MNDLLNMLNHLAATALGEWDEGNAAQLRSLVLDAEGARLVLWLDHPLARGEVVFRIETAPPEGQRQTLRVTLQQAPPELAERLEPFRRLLERARVSIDLDFS